MSMCTMTCPGRWGHADTQLPSSALPRRPQMFARNTHCLGCRAISNERFMRYVNCSSESCNVAITQQLPGDDISIRTPSTQQKPPHARYMNISARIYSMTRRTPCIVSYLHRCGHGRRGGQGEGVRCVASSCAYRPVRTTRVGVVSAVWLLES